MPLYGLPEAISHSQLPDWPKGVSGIPAVLPDGTQIEIPVLSGINVLTTGVVGTGKTMSFTFPAAKAILAATPTMKGVFFEIKRTFIDAFLEANDKVIAYDLNAVAQENLFRPCLIKEIRQAANPEAEMRQIAEFLFSDLLEDANQNLGWVQAARNTFIGVLRVIVECSKETTSNRTLVNALRQMTVEELLQYLAKHPRNHSILRKDFGFDPNSAAAYEVTKRAGDILFFFNQILESFAGAFETDGQDTLHDYLDGKYGRNLFFLYDLEQSAICRPHMLYYLKKLKDYKLSNRALSTEPMLWVFDEIDKLAEGGKAADFGLFQAATLGRQYGLQILLTTQSVEHLFGLSSKFNEHTTVGGISGFPVILSFRPGDPTTIQSLQRLFGSEHREHIVLPVSRHNPAEIKYELEPAVTDSEFASLGTGECYVKIKSSPPQRVHITGLEPMEASHGI